MNQLRKDIIKRITIMNKEVLAIFEDIEDKEYIKKIENYKSTLRIMFDMFKSDTEIAKISEAVLGNLKSVIEYIESDKHKMLFLYQIKNNEMTSTLIEKEDINEDLENNFKLIV